MFPDHDHGGGVEFAVAHELSADGFTFGGLTSGEAIADMLIGTHGTGAVLDDVHGLELGEVDGAAFGGIL